MYSQLLYFVVALLLFTIQQPGAQPFLPPLETFVLAAGCFALYGAICNFSFHRLRRALLEDLPQSALTLRYHRLQTQLSLLALGMLVFHVYFLNIKFYLQRIPGFEESITLGGIAGLVLLLIHQAVIWFLSYPLYQRIYRSSMGRASFLRGHLSFSSAILIPWLLTSILTDLLQVLKGPSFLKSEAGQFILLGFVLILFVFFAPPLVVRLWGCRTLPEGAQRRDLEDFCAQQRFALGDFKLWPLFGGEMLTAGIMGILPRLRYILITKGLMTILDREELRAVVGHEMGHVRRLHLPFYLIFFLSYVFLTYSLNDYILLFLLKHEPFLGWFLTPDHFHLTLFSSAFSIPTLVMLVVYFRFIFGFFLRNSERQADLYALQLLGHPFALISSLQKIALYSGHIEDLPSWHHYSIRERINFLLEAHNKPDLIAKHHKMLYGAATLFVVIVIGLGIASLQLKNSRFMQGWRMELNANIAEHLIRREPENAKLYIQYGGLLIELGRYGQAESALRKAFDLSPDDASVMNNLAWLYATAPPPYLNPGAALDLALQATALDSNPQYLDTLAEAYYANGKYKDALETIEKALLDEPDNRDYYLKQRDKFEEALKHQKAGRRSVLLFLKSGPPKEMRATLWSPSSVYMKTGEWLNG